MICNKCLAPVATDAATCQKCGQSVYTPLKTDTKKRLGTTKEWHASEPANPSKPVSTKPVSATSLVKEPEHLMPWLVYEGKKAIATLPKRAKILSIYVGIIFLVNLIFWSIDPYFMPSYLQPFRKAISTVVFLTATYNDIVPKTIFWVLLFTFGRKLFKSMRKKGFGASFSCMKNTIPQFKAALTRLGTKAYATLLLGAGFGLIIANNFASYSRFSGARNKFDKYFIVIVIAFTISYMIGEASKTGFFKFVKLASKDLAKLMGKKSGLSDDGITVLLSGFIIGLLLDAPLIWIKWMYGGYIMGFVLIIAAVVLAFTGLSKAGVKS